MLLRVDEPEPQLVLRLESHGSTVVLLANVAGSDDPQEIMRFEAGAKPSHNDPLAQRTTHLIAFTRKVRAGFPIEVDAHGHLVVRMKA